MYFKKLELIGFKSFADKTVLNFEPGVTAIVGPNGCGKSNIFDGIRWVLGEQSVKAMRGSSMEDVIFNGTSNKPALGFAEVSLTFSNENKILPIDYEEVTIARRLFRSGESEYLINKSQVRLKDVNELLMGTGIASESYSLVEQGKIDLVLSSRPEERRSIFDEAAGITKYKSKKKEALSKLEDTEENLIRLADIITEVERQLSSVERQAAKARRYQEHFEHLKDLEVKKALFELSRLNAEIQQLTLKKTSFGEGQAAIENSIASIMRQMEDLQSDLSDCISAIESSDKEALKADSLVERANDQIKVSKERIGEYQQRAEGLTKEKELILDRIKNEKARLGTIRQEFDSFDDICQEKQSQLKTQSATLETIAKEIDLSRQAISDAKKSILEITNQLAKARNDSSKTNSDLTTVLARKHRLQIEKAKVSEEKQGVVAHFKILEADLNNKTAKTEELRQDLVKTKKSLEENLAAFKELEVNLSELEKEYSSLESQKEFLTNLKSKYADTGGARSGIVFIDSKDLKPGMGFLGKIDLIDEAGKDNLRDLGASFTNAKKIRCQLKIIDLDLDRLIQKEEEVLSKLSQEKEKRDSLSNLIKSAEDSLKTKEAALKEEEILFANINTQFKIVSQDVSKLDQESQIVDEELREVEAEVTSLTKDCDKSKAKVQELEGQIKKAEDSIVSNQDSISNLTKKREATIIDITQLETNISSFADKRLSLESSLRTIESSLTQDDKRFKDCESQIEDCRVRIEKLTKQIEELTKEIENNQKSKQVALERLEDLRKNREATFEKIKAEQKSIDEKNNELNRLRQEEFSIASKEQELNFQILNIKNRIDANFHVNLDSCETPAEKLSEAEASNLATQIATLKEKLDSYGTVNLVAIEEHEELKKRIEFLTNQRNDLLVAKDSIHKAIAKINQTTKKMFTQTFEKIQVNFKDYFKLLFSGGEAQLYLTDENNVLESGIEIVCRPPGKKLQNISLLSGGEKSLSAIALIFAVFKVKPSPFCVLDEIDAALDESNIDRYNRVLHEFLKTTQFIIITHNKKTITNADVMYGITMQESGVSKIVSVKFAKDKTEKTHSKEPAKESAKKDSPAPTVLNN